MLSKKRNQPKFVSIEELVSKNHLLREIDRVVDFTHVYDIFEDNGRQSDDAC